MKVAQSPAASGRAAKCRICGKAAPAGAALCVQCRDAVKRARQVPTVMSQFMPLALSVSGGGAGAAPISSGPRAMPDAKPSRTGGGSAAFMAIAAFGLAICVGGFFLALENDDAAPPSDIVPADPGAQRPPISRAQLPPPALPAQDDAPDASSAEPKPELPPAVAATAPNPATTATRKAAAVARTPATAGATATAHPDGDIDGRVPEPAAATPETGPAQAAAPVAPEPVVVDRWQAMNAAIAACGRENFFAGVICEQRVRLRYCDGYWGEVAQCGKRSVFDSNR